MNRGVQRRASPFYTNGGGRGEWKSIGMGGGNRVEWQEHICEGLSSYVS